MKKDIAIIAAAQNISPETIERFKDGVRSSKPAYGYDILIGGSKEEKFFKTKILNQLIRDNLNKYNVIIQTDIDLIVPPTLINRTYEGVAYGNRTAYHHSLRYVDAKQIAGLRYDKYPFLEWVNLQSMFCSGCWNGMSVETWRRTRGYNEEMFAWGYEDTEFFHRSRRLGIQWIKRKEFALVHINHETRQKNMVKENTSVGNKYADQTDWLQGIKVLKEDRKKKKVAII